MSDNKEMLGTAPIGKLLFKLAVPTVVAQMALAEAGIKLYGGVCGSCDAAVEALLGGTLGFNPNVKCNHHDHHGEGHTCGDHGCGHNCSSNNCH